MSTAEFKTQPETYLNAALAFCVHCGKVEQARIMGSDQGVFMDRVCEKTGTRRTKLAASLQWYRDRMDSLPPLSKVNFPRFSKNGCPLDCGVCQWHSNRLRLPVFSITNDCNLDCPKCFTFNRPDEKYFKSVEDTRKIIHHIVEQSSGVQLINLTGGEPTLHPHLFDILDACRHEKIQRITMNTNGLRLAGDYSFARRLKDTGVHVVLSMDTLDPATSLIIHGKDIAAQKRKALEVLESLDIPTTILHVCIRGVNEHETAALVHSLLKKSFVRGSTIQNMTFTGKNGSQFQPHEHITIDEVEALLCQTGDFSPGDFFPHGGYHPLCYSSAYYIVCREKLFPLTRVLGWDTLRGMSQNTYALDPGRDISREFMDGINNLWAVDGDNSPVKELKTFIRRLYPADRSVSVSQRQAWVEKNTKMILIHPHMDADNFDIDRVSRCGDLVPDETGALIPACSYNLLYRQKDPRFWVDSPAGK